jgi:hypothetical protein
MDAGDDAEPLFLRAKEAQPSVLAELWTEPVHQPMRARGGWATPYAGRKRRFAGRVRWTTAVCSVHRTDGGEAQPSVASTALLHGDRSPLLSTA